MKLELPRNSLFAVLLRSPWWIAALLAAGVFGATRLFLPIARRAGLPVPETRVIVNGVEVDFYWPELGLVVETDSLRYHRTPAQQNRDRLRDQTHAAAGLIPLRFTHWQIAFDQEHVRKTLAGVVARAARRPAPPRTPARRRKASRVAV